MSTLELIRDAIIDGDKKGTVATVEQALTEEIHALNILNEAMIPAMSEVGKRFESGEYFVPEMLVSAKCMKEGVKLLRPLLALTDMQPLARVAIGTVRGDLHDIGKNLVIMMLEGAGFAVTDLGVDAPPEKFIEAAKAGNDVIAMSALLTTTMPAMKVTIEAMKQAGVRDNVKIIVGGAPLTQAYAESIGADGYSTDANSAIRLVKGLLQVG